MRTSIRSAMATWSSPRHRPVLRADRWSSLGTARVSALGGKDHASDSRRRDHVHRCLRSAWEGCGGSRRVMRAQKVFGAVDSHTEGMPTRVITSGVGVLPGATMFDRMRYLVTERDDLRTLLMCEPRGHAAMSGAILQPPTRQDADVGVVFIEVSGCLPMCGHGTMGTATVLVETGMVELKEPVTLIRLDTPAGLVEASVEVADGRAASVTIRNVASYLHLRDAVVRVPGLGELTLDLAFGGNFYAILPAASVGLEVRPDRHDEIIDTGLRIMDA